MLAIFQYCGAFLVQPATRLLTLATDFHEFSGLGAPATFCLPFKYGRNILASTLWRLQGRTHRSAPTLVIMGRAVTAKHLANVLRHFFAIT